MMATFGIHTWHCFKARFVAGGRSWHLVKSTRSSPLTSPASRLVHCVKGTQQTRITAKNIKPLSSCVTALQQRNYHLSSESCWLLLLHGSMPRNCIYFRGFSSQDTTSHDLQTDSSSGKILKDTTDLNSVNSTCKISGGYQISNDEHDAHSGSGLNIDRHASDSDNISNTQGVQTALDSGSLQELSETQDAFVSEISPNTSVIPSDIRHTTFSLPAWNQKDQQLQENDEAHSLQAQRELQALQDLPPPRPMEPSFNLAVYVPQSLVLQKLVGLGVDLSAVEKIPEAADCVVQADWDRDIEPRLLFLHDVGVNPADMGSVLTKNPLVLKEDLQDMKLRISYLQSKRFSSDQISHIITKAPVTLLLPVKYLDKKLGFLQNKFHLTGDEVRLVATKLPKLLPWKLQKLKDLQFYVKEMLGFSNKEQKAMLLSAPRLYLSNRYQLGERFDFLHNTMGLTHQYLAAWPSVFRTRLHLLQQRHRFLLFVGRAQYDPTKENYVSLKALVSGNDHDFCANVAKATAIQFYDFLKTL